MKRKSFKGGALTAPVPAAIVTVGNMEKYGALTVSWTGILATVPPKTYVSIRPSRNSYPILKEGGEFVVNLPSADMARAVDYIGIYSGKKVDKLEKCALTKVKSERVDAPTVAECPIALECVVSEVIPMGSHDVFVADIVSVSAREDLIDAEGKIRFDRANLLAYAHGEYFLLGEKVGRFGFSTDKGEEKRKKSNAISELGSREKKKITEIKNQIAKGDIKNGSDIGKQLAKGDTKNGSGTGKQLAKGNTKNGSGGERLHSTSESKSKRESEEKKRPFYLDAPRGKRAKAISSDKDKGRPHGKRTKKSGSV
ncbi:MAG: flavin reductase family protein [Clostridia bacterium]|nr:flavin reductase family protein [Clostridia bacterium]